MSDKLKTHKFARKTFYVDAVRVSEENIARVAEWCGGEIQTDEEALRYIKVKVNRPLTDRQAMAYLGDWVLDSGNGFKVYTQKAFDKSFEKVRTLTKAQADEAGIRVPHEPRKYSKKQADELGIKVPHEPSIKPENPREITNAKLHSVNIVSEEPDPANGVYPIEVIEAANPGFNMARVNEAVEEEKAAQDPAVATPRVIPPRKKDAVDRLFDEVTGKK